MNTLVPQRASHTGQILSGIFDGMRIGRFPYSVLGIPVHQLDQEHHPHSPNAGSL